jgi:hypothetical protein
MQKCLQFFDYAASQEDAIVTYQASNMRLTIHSNASYLSEPNAQSRAGGHMFMAGTEDIPINNGAVLNILQIIRAVMSSSAEAKLGALFINAKMWICNSIGCIATKHRTSINFTGDLEHKILADCWSKHHPASHHQAFWP